MKQKIKIYSPTLDHPFFSHVIRNMNSVEFMTSKCYLLPSIHPNSGLNKIVNARSFDLYECYDGGLPINKIPFIAHFESTNSPWWHKEIKSINPVLRKKITNIKKEILESNLCKLIIFQCQYSFNKNIQRLTNKMLSKSIVLNGGISRHKPNKLDDKKDINLLFVGHDFERKGGDILLDAFDELNKKYKDLKLTVFSNVICSHPFFTFSEKKKETYIRRMNKNKNIHLIMYEDVFKSEYGYSAADILVFPTLIENLGTTIIDVESYGVPIISTNIGGIPNLAEHGVNAFLIDAFNIRIGNDFPTFGTDKKKYHAYIKKELIKYLTILIENYPLRKKMGIESYKIWKRRFSLDKRIKVLDLIYKEAIKDCKMNVNKIKKKIRMIYKE